MLRIALVLFGLSLSLLFAQPSDQYDITSWYLEERFILADRDENALLSRSELEAFPREFRFYLEDRNFSATDANNDDFLSFSELESRTRSEFVFRYTMERRELRDLAVSYPMLEQADADYLKSNPELVASLFANIVWLEDNAELAEDIFRDRNWTHRYPETKRVLQQNLCWLVMNPRSARFLYRDTELSRSLPYLSSWRAEHQVYMRKFARLDGEFYLPFWPQARN